MENSSRKPGWIKHVWQQWRRPNCLALDTLLLVGFMGDIIFWGGLNTGMEKANAEEFYTSCHEMRNTAYQEYMETVHYNNRSGVRTICPDHHIPHEWGLEMIHKIKTSKELYAKILGLIDTPQKFKDHRLTMAQNEWRRMKNNNSQECRNCHSLEFMDLTAQEGVAAKMHDRAMKDRQTCVDCRKGIARKLPDICEIEPGLQQDVDNQVCLKPENYFASEMTKYCSAVRHFASTQGNGHKLPVTTAQEKLLCCGCLPGWRVLVRGRFADKSSYYITCGTVTISNCCGSDISRE